MSNPSSDGRQSLSSEPSAASSNTLNSRYSGAYQDNGEGSSSQPPSMVHSRHHSGYAHESPDRHSRTTGSTLPVDLIEEQDFAHRKQRNRRSGGFLLDSAFGSGPRARLSYNGPHVEDAKQKRSSRHGHTYSRDGQHARPRTRDEAANGSPLSREVRMADQDGSDRRIRVDSAEVQDQGNGGLSIAKTRKSTHLAPPMPDNRGSEPEAPPTHPAIDPNQIVHMALNLSESRRRNLSAGQLLVPQPRVASGIHQDGSFRNYGAGSSLRQYLNEQRRASRNISPHGGRSSPSRHMSASMQRSGSLFIQGRPIDPSDATLARRDKARAFFELRMEYLRLLEFLPPLKPDSSEPGNFIITANNVPGSPHAHLTRMPSYAGKKYDLGRQYNPLQALRNRRTRARERKTLDHQPEEFADVEQVRDWIDRIEKATRYPEYRQEDGVSLPKLHDDHQISTGPAKPARPHMVWTFSAEELLADAHWLEHGDNKTVIEDRHGRKIFPPREPQKQDLLLPRSSKDYPERRRRSWVEGLQTLTGDQTTGDESEAISERGRKRRILPTFRAESPKHKKHVRVGSRPHSGSYTDSSGSDSDARQHRPRKPRRIIDVNNNTGPLELRMKELMEKEAKETQAKVKSPAIFTPDTPNKWGIDKVEVAESKVSQSSLQVPELANGSMQTPADLGLKMPPKIRTDNTLSLKPSTTPRASLDEPPSSAPSSPLHIKQFSHADSDLSPPPSRGGSIRDKPKKSRLDIFRSEEGTKGHKRAHSVEPQSATSEKKRSSRHVSEEMEDGNGFSSAIWAAPGAVKNLLSHRKNDSVSTISSMQSPVRDHRKETRDVKEPPSAVTRFFKGVKNEGSKVGEFIFRKDRPPEDSDTDTASEQHSAPGSDSEDARKQEGKRRPKFARSTTAETTGSFASKSGRYHLDLPSFRSSNQRNDEDLGYVSDTNLSDHHITRQARERANSRSARFEELAPPRMDLSRISSRSSNSESLDRINRILARPGGVGQGGLPVTALGKGNASDDTARQRSSSRPKLDGKRHWSITDEDGNVLHRKATPNIVTHADIARVRALFLCSGVKAKEIVRRAHEVRSEPAAFLTRAAKISDAQLIPVSKKEEHVLAARILVRNLESSTQALHTSADEFRDPTVKELTSMISTLKSKVESDLFPRVRNSSDEAVKTTSEVSSNAPLTVKQINDEIDRMLRVRRRRMRWVRRVGWTMVEWMLLGFMWFAWLTVTTVAFVLRVFGFGWRVVRWLLWI